ncbi:helix-turn-helix domain-containing protein [Gemella morbillorum]|uniref:helix-turn-helix domain-containing protein n=1 Tax=Gemella morbillorum TaxID=29391 RepID=UPI00248F165D|nr:helix-turn-helix transcriptional regulator [Gemella morbillorum]
MEISEKIKQRRKYLGLSKRELAEKISVHETSIGKYEQGKVDFPVSKIKKLAKALEVSEIWLLGLEGEPKQNTCDITEPMENLINILSNNKEVTFKDEPIGVYYQQYTLDILKEILKKITTRQNLVKIVNRENTDPSITILKENPEKLKKQAKKDVENLFEWNIKQIKNPSGKEEHYFINTTKVEGTKKEK